MAKILPGIAVSKMSGTIAGTTYSNWRGILVARSKPTPTNTNTPRQTYVRSLLSSLSQAWRDELTPGLRQAWNNRASSYPWLDVFGNSVFMTGENLYIKQNFVLLDYNKSRVDTPQADKTPTGCEGATLDLASSDPNMVVIIPGISASEITDQASFVQVLVAGGSTELQKVAAPEEVFINSPGLPQGRTPQKSDYRVAAYFSRSDTAVMDQTLGVDLRPLLPRKASIILRAFNKQGNFSAPLHLEYVAKEAVPVTP